MNNLRQQMEKSGKIKINEKEMKGLTRSAPGEEVYVKGRTVSDRDGCRSDQHKTFGMAAIFLN